MTSFAKTVSPSGIQAASPRPDFHAARLGESAATPGRESSMVANDRPAPAPHPSPDMAGASDRAAFNARWENEQREARKAAFIEKRTGGQAQGRDRAPAQDFNRTIRR